jgi:DNA-binding beta-propeller fold protein YncE
VLTRVPGPPFGVVATVDGRFDFVSLGSALSVRENLKHGAPPEIARVRLQSGVAVGETLTRDGRYLLVADGMGGADVINVHAAERGTGNAVVGVLGGQRGGRGFGGGGAIEVTTSADGRFAFVSLEGSGDVAVFNPSHALTSGFGRADFVGMIPVGVAPVGMALSPDGRWLYVTSENATHSSLGPLSGDHGTLSVINVPKAEISPAASLVASVDAGCEPVRVITSADGSIVWVTARASNALLAFSAAKLVSAPAHALITGVRVGEAPVGLALVKNGSRIVVADSNRP